MANGATRESNRFLANLPEAIQVPAPADVVGWRVLREYGALYVARGVHLPAIIVFPDEASTSTFQASIPRSRQALGGMEIELQAPAMDALLRASEEARQAGLAITPRNSDAAGRSYSGTAANWASRVEPGLNHWVAQGRISRAEAYRIRARKPADQVADILRLEAQGVYFSTQFNKTILQSVAPPGASQHLAFLALDIREHDNAKVRKILAWHGWYQTIPSDLPHFTYLGVSANQLPLLGLKQEIHEGRSYWTPDL